MKIIRNQIAISDVVAIILMVALTVAVAATVYVYVSSVVGSPSETDEDYIYKVGIFQGYYDIDSDPIVINNEHLNVYSEHDDRIYLQNFIGQNITLVLVEYDYRDYDYRYVGAYLNLEE